MFESKSGVFIIAGLGFFALAFLVMAVLPWTIYMNQEEQTLADLAGDHKNGGGILHEFVELREKFPEQFKTHFGEVSEKSFAEALQLGHKVYVGEGCWHCHSQQVRPLMRQPVSSECTSPLCCSCVTSAR